MLLKEAVQHLLRLPDLDHRHSTLTDAARVIKQTRGCLVAGRDLVAHLVVLRLGGAGTVGENERGEWQVDKGTSDSQGSCLWKES